MNKPLCSFTVPGRPTPKPRPRVGRYGTYYRPPAKGSKRLGYPEYKELVQACAKAALGPRPVDVEGLYQLEITAYLTSYKGDWDNIGGTISDALEGVIWENDSRVMVGKVSKCVAPKRKECWVEVQVYEI
jgi:crossover junction endodeoxyribonuclease RusA